MHTSCRELEKIIKKLEESVGESSFGDPFVFRSLAYRTLERLERLDDVINDNPPNVVKPCAK
eukprot:3588939-Amphidinium_carterae.1